MITNKYTRVSVKQKFLILFMLHLKSEPVSKLWEILLISVKMLIIFRITSQVTCKICLYSRHFKDFMFLQQMNNPALNLWNRLIERVLQISAKPNHNHQLLIKSSMKILLCKDLTTSQVNMKNKLKIKLNAY